MLLISIVLLHVLSVLSQPSSTEYLSSVFDKDDGDVGTYLETLSRYARKENPRKGRIPTAYLYMTKDRNPPTEKQCITCLYELYQKNGDKLDVCKCLPCWIQTSKEETAQKFVIEIFERHYCGNIKHTKRIKPKKNEKEEIHSSGDRRKTGKKNPRMNSGTNVKDVKYVDEYLNDSDKLEQWSGDVSGVAKTINRGQLTTVENTWSSDSPETSTGEDCRDQTLPLRDTSKEVVKEKVKRVFGEVMTKMVRMDKASEEENVTDEPTDVSLKNRWRKDQRSEGSPQMQPVKRYENQFQRPSFRLASPLKRDHINVKRTEKSDESAAEGDEDEIKQSDAQHEEITELEIQKSSKSMDEKLKKPKKGEDRNSEVPEGIPEDISIGSLTFEEPSSMYVDDDDEDQVHDDGFASVKGSTVVDGDEHGRDYNIHYYDDTSEEGSPKNTKLKETRNTPSDRDGSPSRTTATTVTEIYLSEEGKATPCGAMRISNNNPSSPKSSTITEEPTSKVPNEKNESTTTLDESSTSILVDNEGTLNDEEDTETTETNIAENPASELDNSSGSASLMNEESTTTSSPPTLILKFTKDNVTTEKPEKSEEPVTETTVTSTSASTSSLSYETSTELITKGAENYKIIAKVEKKFTRSTDTTVTNPFENTSQKNTGTAESTGSDRFLRQTDSNDARSDTVTIDGRRNAAELVEAAENRSVDPDRNITQQKNPRYIIELEEDPEKTGKNCGPEEPFLKVKMNIYSDSEPGNVYNFLSKLMSMNRNVEEETEANEGTRASKKRKGLRIETNFPKGTPKPLKNLKEEINI